jgi:hypothetical protein
VRRPENAVLLKYLVDNGFVARTTLEDFVHTVVMEAGREMYEIHTRRNVPPDHLASPDVFGYAIAHGAFTERELKKIRFDHGETLDEYRAKAEGLLVRLVDQLLSPPERAAFVSRADGDGCFCEGCPVD